jgi:hypothetical protein
MNRLSPFIIGVSVILSVSVGMDQKSQAEGAGETAGNEAIGLSSR